MPSIWRFRDLQQLSYDNKESYEGFKKRVTSLRRLYDAAGYNYGKHAFPADSTSTAVVEK